MLWKFFKLESARKSLWSQNRSENEGIKNHSIAFYWFYRSCVQNLFQAFENWILESILKQILYLLFISYLYFFLIVLLETAYLFSIFLKIRKKKWSKFQSFSFNNIIIFLYLFTIFLQLFSLILTFYSSMFAIIPPSSSLYEGKVLWCDFISKYFKFTKPLHSNEIDRS